MYQQSGDGDKNIDANSFVSPFISDGGPEFVHYGNLLCDSLIHGKKVSEGNVPIGMNNYTSRKIAERDFEFTFHYTKADVAKADTCR